MTGAMSNIPFLDVNLGLLAADIRESAADTSNRRQSEHDLLLAINVGVEHTQNVLELIGYKKRLDIVHAENVSVA